MTFPYTPLDQRVELLLSGTWTDITSYVQRRDDLVVISRGRRDEATQLDQSRCSMSLNNRDGRFSQRNPTGAYYGLIGRNTQLRHSVPYGATYLKLDSTTGDKATAPDAAALGITGDIDIRLDASLMSWRHPQDLAAKYVTTSNQRSWALQLDQTGKLTFIWTTAGTLASRLSSTSTLPVPIPGDHRRAVRVTLDVNNGAAGNTATFYYADTITGTWTQLGDPVVTAGTTSIFDSTAGLEVGDIDGLTALVSDTDIASHAVTGKVHAFQLLSGIAGTTVANPNFTIQTAGATSFADTAAAPNTWTIAATAALDDRAYRFHGEISEWPQRWDGTGSDIWTPVEARGILRRLSQGASPLNSAMYRYLTDPTNTNPPVAYWPGEDVAGSTVIASGINAGRAMRINGTPTLASDSSFATSSPLPVVNSSIWTGAVVPYTTTTIGQVGFLLAVPSGGDATGAIVAAIKAAGNTARLDVVYTTASSGSLTLKMYNADGALDVTSAALTAVNGKLVYVTVTMEQVTTNIAWTFEYIEVGGASFDNDSSTLGGSDFGRISSIVIDPDANLAASTVGHISVHAGQSTSTDLADPIAGYDGETAGRRIERLCTEEEITFRWAGDLDDTQAMGPQSVTTLLSLLQEAVDADGGLLYEPREVLGLGYRPRTSLYNQDPCLTLDYASNELFETLDPTDDDQNTRNDRTVARTGGSSARAELTTGDLSTASPPDGVGRYSDSTTVNVQTDDVLPDIANWLLHLGTINEERYPVVTTNLANTRIAADTALVADATQADIGDALAITNPPAWLPPGTITQIIQGYTETCGNFEHAITYNCTPASGWNITYADDPTYGRIDTDGSTLASSATSTATSLSVASSGITWTTSHSETPWNLLVAGEEVTAVALGTVVNDNPLLLTDATGWSANNATISYSTAFIQSAYDAAASILVVPNGVSASGGVNAGTHSAVGTITPGASYTINAWVYSPLGWADLRTAVDWYDAADAFISSSLGSATVVAAATWTFLTQTFTAPALSSRAVARARFGATPAATDTSYWWNIRLIADSTVATTSPQTMTVVRSINGVVKAQASGATVALATPAIVAL